GIDPRIPEAAALEWLAGGRSDWGEDVSVTLFPDGDESAWEATIVAFDETLDDGFAGELVVVGDQATLGPAGDRGAGGAGGTSIPPAPSTASSGEWTSARRRCSPPGATCSSGWRGSTREWRRRTPWSTSRCAPVGAERRSTTSRRCGWWRSGARVDEPRTGPGRRPLAAGIRPGERPAARLGPGRHAPAPGVGGDLRLSVRAAGPGAVRARPR